MKLSNAQKSGWKNVAVGFHQWLKIPDDDNDEKITYSSRFELELQKGF